MDCKCRAAALGWVTWLDHPAHLSISIGHSWEVLTVLVENSSSARNMATTSRKVPRLGSPNSSISGSGSSPLHPTPSRGHSAHVWPKPGVLPGLIHSRGWSSMDSSPQPDSSHPDGRTGGVPGVPSHQNPSPTKNQRFRLIKTRFRI